MHVGIIELIKNDNKRAEFEAQSFELFNQKYNIDNTIVQLEDIYKQLISR